MATLNLEIPRKLAPLVEPARYKGAHGGRGGAKSHFFAEQLILRCYQRPTRAACIREVQNTLKESVRQLLIDKIQKLGLGDFFQVLESEVRAKNGSLIIFRGMQSYNAESIKSLEGYDIAWVEEAQTLSDISLRMLRPTIRKAGSEIWFSWNPRHDTDAVDVFLRGPHRPKDAIVIEVNHYDNPWFPDVLQAEMERDYQADPEMAAHVWGGGYEIVSEGAYYARLIAQAEQEGRVGHFPYNPMLPVFTSWDLGVDDFTAIWFMQEDGRTATAIDYYEVQGVGADEIISYAVPEQFVPPQLQEEYIGWTMEQALAELDRPIPFKYAKHFLPHDIKMREWGNGARSRILTAQALGLRPIYKGAATNPADRIAAVRDILPKTRFHMTPRVAQGIKRLRRYRRKWNDALGTYQAPEHNDDSHGADAFGEFAINCRIREAIVAPPVKPKPDAYLAGAGSSGLMQSTLTMDEIVRRAERRAKR